MIKVLVAEDSRVVSTLLANILEGDPEIKVVGVAENGIEAVSMARNLRPDVITMDIRMPKMGGVEATRLIMSEAPTRIIIVSGAVDEHESRPAFEATKEGALTVVEKPRGYRSEDFDKIRTELIKTVKRMSTVKVITRWAHKQQPSLPAGPASDATVKIVAIGASTGGPAALSHILRSIPADIPAPIVIVQHMASGFSPAFASWLDVECQPRVTIADEGGQARPGNIYVAPDDHHLGVEADGTFSTALDYSLDAYHRPSVDYLFSSVANNFRSGGLGVLLTGMGEDGARGLKEIRTANGRTIAQDETSSIVFGMPKAAITLDAAEHILPLNEIGPRLISLARQGAMA